MSRTVPVSSLQPGPDPIVTPETPPSDPAERSLADDLRQLSQEARALVQAEVAYQKSRAAFAGQEVKRIVLLGIVAAVILFFAVMALVFGLVLALTPVLTAWGATAVVVGALLLIAGGCAFSALSRWRRMTAALSDETA